MRKLDAGVHVVSGTPGRVKDMMERQKLRTRHIKVTVCVGGSVSDSVFGSVVACKTAGYGVAWHCSARNTCCSTPASGLTLVAVLLLS